LIIIAVRPCACRRHSHPLGCPYEARSYSLVTPMEAVRVRCRLSRGQVSFVALRLLKRMFCGFGVKLPPSHPGSLRARHDRLTQSALALGRTDSSWSHSRRQASPFGIAMIWAKGDPRPRLELEFVSLLFLSQKGASASLGAYFGDRSFSFSAGGEGDPWRRSDCPDRNFAFAISSSKLCCFVDF